MTRMTALALVLVASCSDSTGISDYGEVDLDLDRAALADPSEGMPPLVHVPVEVSPVHHDQVLPETAPIHELDGAAWVFRGATEEELEAVLREHGSARKRGDHWELMSHAQTWVGDYSDTLLTADSVLHTYHNAYDNMLLAAELRALRPQLTALLEELSDGSARRYNALPKGPTRDAALDVHAWCQVALTLMEPTTTSAPEVEEVVGQELALVMAHQGAEPSPILDRPELESHSSCLVCDPCRALSDCADPDQYPELAPCPERYCEDYSQYVPRGHYTWSPELEQYFRSVMWLGRTGWLNRSDASTRGAVVLLDSLKDADVDGEPGPVVWARLFRVIGAFVGGADDLTPAEVDAAVLSVLGEGATLDQLDDDAVVDDIQAAVAELRDPAILSGFKASRADLGQATKGLRLLGQVYLPDSYLLSQVVYGHVGPSDQEEGYDFLATEECKVAPGTPAADLTEAQEVCVCSHAWKHEDYVDVCRGMPSGLDVLAGLGHAPARDEALSRWGEHQRYPEQLEAMTLEFETFDLDDWGTSGAWTWLWALRGLVADTDPGAPAFARQPAWEDKTTETAASSWAQLRHDTILYVKQSYTETDTDTDTDTDADVDHDFDYVEPVPELYERLATGTRRLEVLARDDTLYGEDSDYLLGELDELATFCERARDIGVKELEGEPLDYADIWFIRNSGDSLGRIEDGILTGLGILASDEEPDEDRLKTSIIADVHTFPGRSQVLEVGTGYVDWITVLHQLPSGEWGVATGPAFSYHEFSWPMNDRLTDEEWRTMLASDPDRGRPEWLDPGL